MYATSSEHTRVPWAAHSYNVAFSDEIGHFEYCDKANDHGKCIKPGVGEMKDGALNFVVTNSALGGDPAVGADKVLIVVYRYQGTETATAVREGNTLTLP